MKTVIVRQPTINWEWPNFTREEVLPPTERKNVHVNIYLMDSLELLRENVGNVPLLLNDYHRGGKLRYRGFRTRWQNATIGGAKNSFHTMFRAADVSCHLVTLDELADAGRRIFGGIIIYPTFVHFDMRFGTYFKDKRK